MPCPNCDGTFTPVGCCLVMGQTVHYCTRCGTLKPCDQSVDDLVVPELVRRCREFEKFLVNEVVGNIEPGDASMITNEGHRLGIAEACNLPGDRKL